MLAEEVACQTARIMLESLVRDKTFGNLEAWEYMEMNLCSERLSGLHPLNKGRSTSLGQNWFGVDQSRITGI